MQLNNTTQYAIRILTYLAKEQNNSLLSAKEIAEKLNIPYKFLTKIMTELTKAELIISIRGREGGYKLKTPASKINISKILNIFNDSLNQKKCLLGIGFCDTNNKCALHDQWIKPKTQIKKMFEDTTLEEIANKDTKL
ncbi:RrF2 family transcriptional regulator [Sulfurospirillum sp. 1307]